MSNRIRYVKVIVYEAGQVPAAVELEAAVVKGLTCFQYVTTDTGLHGLICSSEPLEREHAEEALEASCDLNMF